MSVSLLSGFASAAPADLDRSFGGDGIVQVENAGGATFPSDASARIAIGPDDGTIVLYSTYACAWQFECPTDLTLARYDAAGNRDASFGAQIRVQEGPERHPFDLAVGPDGKAIVAAYDLNGGEEGSCASTARGTSIPASTPAVRPLSRCDPDTARRSPLPCRLTARSWSRPKAAGWKAARSYASPGT